MALTVYLCGHGSWQPSDGYFTLPAGCTLTFMIDFAKCLYTNDMYAICEGTYVGAPYRTVEGYKSCPNMTWTVDEASKKRICENALARNPKHASGSGNPARLLFPSSTKTLKRFFEVSDSYIRSDIKLHGSVDFIWNCCTAVELRATKMGGLSGVNAAVGSGQFDYVDFTTGTPRFLGIHSKRH